MTATAASLAPLNYTVTVRATGASFRGSLDECAAFVRAARRPVLRLVGANEQPAPRASLRWLWNGVKVNSGALQGARYHLSGAEWDAAAKSWTAHTAITVSHNSHCGSFSGEIAAAFDVRNNTDSQTDYFDHDRFTVAPGHPEFIAIAEATIKAVEHEAKRRAKWCERRGVASDHDTSARDIAQLRALIAQAAKIN